jgi:hypothetical protein
MKPILFLLLLLTLIINCSNLTRNRRNKRVQDINKKYLPAQISIKNIKKNEVKTINVLYKKKIEENDEGLSIIACNEGIQSNYFKKKAIIDQNFSNTNLKCTTLINYITNRKYAEFILPFKRLSVVGKNIRIKIKSNDESYRNYIIEVKDIKKELIEGLEELDKYLNERQSKEYIEQVIRVLNVIKRIRAIKGKNNITNEIIKEYVLQLDALYGMKVKAITAEAEKLNKMFSTIRENLDKKKNNKKNLKSFEEIPKRSLYIDSAGDKNSDAEENNQILTNETFYKELNSNYKSGYPKIKFFVMNKEFEQMKKKFPEFLMTEDSTFYKIYNKYVKRNLLETQQVFEEIAL